MYTAAHQLPQQAHKTSPNPSLSVCPPSSCHLSCLSQKTCHETRNNSTKSCCKILQGMFKNGTCRRHARVAAGTAAQGAWAGKVRVPMSMHGR